MNINQIDREKCCTSAWAAVGVCLWIPGAPRLNFRFRCVLVRSSIQKFGNEICNTSLLSSSSDEKLSLTDGVQTAVVRVYLVTPSFLNF
jgi:hypothetical protein